ncbi:MAG: glycosyltransferase family 4 protein [Algisphaera sp.]
MSGGVLPMRLAVVIESFDLAAGGNERSTQQMMDELVARGHDVTLIAGACSNTTAALLEAQGVGVRRLSARRSSSARRLLAFVRFVKTQLDAGVFDSSLSVTTAAAACVMQPRGGTVCEAQQRNMARRASALGRFRKRIELTLNLKQQMLRRYERQAFADKGVQKVVAISDYVVRQLETHYALPADRMAVIPNAAVSPAAGRDAAAWLQLRCDERAKLGLDDAEVVFLFAAMNPPLKGYAALFEAVKRLPQAAGRPVVVLLAGRFNSQTQTQWDAAGLADCVRVLGPVADMAGAYAAADVVVLPTWYDPASKVVLEGLMVGKPAITTRFNGASAWLRPANAPPRGIVLEDPGDCDALAKALEQMADSAFRAACAAACDGLEDALSMRKHVDALEQVLAQTVSAGDVSAGVS